MTVEPLYPPEEYSTQEQEKLTKFRTRCADLGLTDEQNSDAQLIRWLRARSLDVEKAYQMLSLHLKWRRENNMDTLVEREEVPMEMQKMTPYANLGLDKDGYPILFVPMGRHDGRTHLETYGAETFLRYNFINCEKMLALLRKLSEEQGRPVTQFVEIIDLEGYNFRQLTSKGCRDLMIRMQTTFEANYPELLRYAIFINAPKIFSIIINILKPFVPKETLKKVDIYGPEPEKWKKVIAERFPLEQIPPKWGGTRPGSDEYCSTDSIWMPGPVPLSYFKYGTLTPPMEDDASLTSANISPRDSVKISLEVTKPDCSIAWRFRSQNHDIGFQIVFQDGSVVLPFSRIQSQKQLQEGTHPCSQLGTYTVIFDNTYSLVRSKTVYYSVSVIEFAEIEPKYFDAESSANSEIISKESPVQEVTSSAATVATT